MTVFLYVLKPCSLSQEFYPMPPPFASVAVNLLKICELLCVNLRPSVVKTKEAIGVAMRPPLCVPFVSVAVNSLKICVNLRPSVVKTKEAIGVGIRPLLCVSFASVAVNSLKICVNLRPSVVRKNILESPCHPFAFPLRPSRLTR